MTRYAAFAVSCGLLLAGCGSTVQGQSSVESGLAAGAAGSSSFAPGDAGVGAPPAAASTYAPGSLSKPAVNAPRTSASGGGPMDASPGPDTAPIAGTGGPPRPISIGFFNNNNAQINSEYGYSVPQGEDIDRALVKGINASGGLAGHKIIARFVTYSAESRDYASDAAAACETFTVDSPVSIVISPTISTEYGFADCLQRKGVLLESSWPTDAHSFATHPLLFAASSTTLERGYITALDQLHSSGNVTARDHLGVVLEGCPDDERAWSTGIRPEIRRLGIRVELSTLSCTSGIQDAAAASAAMQSAILKWQGAGVDRVMFVTAYESTLLVLFTLQAEQQQFRPGYVLTSSAEASVVASGGSFPPKQKPGLRGAGTLPGFDVDRPPTPNVVENRCIVLARQAGVQMSASSDRETLYNHCASLFLFEVALKTLPAAPTNTEIRSGLDGLGTQALLPGLVDGRTRLDADHRDAPAFAREFGWRASCSCMTYLGAAAPVTG